MAHTYRWEGGGAAVLGSVQPQPLEHQADGTLALARHRGGDQARRPALRAARGCSALENTLGGKVLPLRLPARTPPRSRGARGLATHLDGARLFNAAVGARRCRARARSRSRFDSVSVCFSQGPGRAGRLGAGRLARVHRRVRTAGARWLGGGMRQAGVAGRGGAARARPPRRAAAPTTTRSRAPRPTASQGMPGLTVEPPQTNIVFADLTASAPPGCWQHLKSRGVLATGLYRLRFVTHLDVDADGVDRAVAAVREYLHTERRGAAMPIIEHRRADAHHRPPRDLPRRDARADAPHHERRDVAGDDGRGAGRPARQEGDHRRDHRRGAGDARVRDQGRGAGPRRTWSTSSAPAATARTPSTSRPAAMFVAAAARRARQPSTATAACRSKSGSADVLEALGVPHRR